jgi:type IV pilus assembly protein PilZ
MLVRPQYARREQRKHRRHALHPVVSFRVGDDGPEIGGVCRDISLGGAFVETSVIPLFSTDIRISVRLPGAHDVCVSATVRWAGKDGMGIQFGPMSARDTHALVEYFHAGRSAAVE